MYWTKTVRGLCKLFMALGIIASLIGGGVMISSGGAAAGILVIVIGIIVAIIGVAFIMMISEIPVLLNDIKTLLQTSSSDKSIQAVVSNQVNNKTNDMSLQNKYWECPECKTVNQSNANFCKKCGCVK